MQKFPGQAWVQIHLSSPLLETELQPPWNLIGLPSHYTHLVDSLDCRGLLRSFWDHAQVHPLLQKLTKPGPFCPQRDGIG